MSNASDEPTEAESMLRFLMMTAPTVQLEFEVLRAHVAAEVAKATAELLKDKERLDWLLGENTVYATTPAGQSWKVREIWANNEKISWREAIDAARAQQKDT